MRPMLAMLVLFLVACGNPAQDQRAKEAAYIRDETDALRGRLKDPQSAEISGAFVSRKAGPPVVCGYVNSKNSFGGFTGKQRFVSASAADTIVTEEDMADGEMDSLWSKVCR